VSSILEVSSEGDLQNMDLDGRLPLHWACVRGHVGPVELIITKTKHKDKRDKEGYTPLHLALVMGENNLSGVIEILLQHLDSVNLQGQNKHDVTLASSASIRSLGVREQLLERLFWMHSPIATEICGTGITKLHFGAWALDPDTVKRSIVDNSASVNLSVCKVPYAWEQNLQLQISEIMCPVARSFYLTPLFLALNSTLTLRTYQTTIETANARDIILRLILESEELDLSQLFHDVQEQYQVVFVRLAAQIACAGMGELLAARGLTLPWHLMSWTCLSEGEEKSGVEIVFLEERDLHSSMVKKMIVPRELIFAVLLGGQCKLIDLLKANYRVASRIIHWELPGQLDLTGADEILIEIYKKGNLADLKWVILLGLDTGRALSAAVRTGNRSLVDFLLNAELMPDAI
jgi:hypothetical protein